MKRDDPNEVLLLLVSWVVLVTLSALVVRRDERRLDDERLSRAWSPASRDSALIGLSLLAAPVLGLFAVTYHFWRTRRFHPLGLLQGLGWTFGILVVNGVVTTAVAWALGVPLE